MRSKIVNVDPVLGKKTELGEDADGLFFKTHQSVDPIIDAAKREANENASMGRGRPNTQKHMRKVAEIPTTMFFEWMRLYGHPKENPSKWKQLLNDPENAYLRTHGGRI